MKGGLLAGITGLQDAAGLMRAQKMPTNHDTGQWEALDL